MQISNRTQKPTLSSTPAPVAVPETKSPVAANAVATPKAPAQAAAASGFEAKSTFAQQAGAKSPVALTAQTAAPAAVTARKASLDLGSTEARAAVQKSLEFIQKQSGGPATRGIVPGGDAASKFTPRSVNRDELGMTHVRLDRTQEGVKVFGEQVISHLDKDGKVSSITGDVSTIPAGLGKDPVKLSAQDAVAVAQKQFQGRTDSAPTAERVILKGNDGQYHAAYQVQMNRVADLKGDERPTRMNYFVDANSGEVLKKFDQIDNLELPKGANAAKATPGSSAGTGSTTPTTPVPGTGTGSGTGKADDTTLYSGKVDLQTTKQADGTYTLEDSTRGKGVVTYDAQNKQQAGKTTKFTDKNDVWGEATDNSRTKAAVDAHYGAEMTYDFYKDVLGRDSIDGKGEKLVSNVHLGTNYDNAYWDGNQMNYGDGDGKEFSPLTTLDIAGHEISHGLTERTAGLVYEGESGGLNEAFSDIMGTGVEWYASQKNSAVKFDWKVGEDAFTPGNGTNDALRYMDDPTKDGYSLDNYKNFKSDTEVHSSSGIANNAFYLLANGGTNRTSGIQVKDGIGMEKSLKVFSRALENYMTPNTTFAQARQATLKAATDLYGANSAEAKKVADAWTAVGVN